MTFSFRPRRSSLVLRAMAFATLAVVAIEADAGAARGATSVRRATNVSSNWAGYAVTGRRATQTFMRVAAQWVQPAAMCRAGQTGYSAFWIGLGGYHRTAHKLEQIGTEADCTRGGATVNYVWYELVPANPVNLRLAVSPGDTISARVSVSGSRVSLMIADLTSGGRVNRTLRMSAPDTSSAEWIAEAPSQCSAAGGCRVLPLADFGAVAFRGASVASAAQTGTISPAGWSTTRVELHNDVLSLAPGQFGVRELLASALPSALSASGSAFNVNWQSAAVSAPSNTPGSFGPPA